MANIENTRSLYLANANPRLLTRATSDVLLSASAPVFKVSADGAPNTPSITFDAIPVAMDSSVTYSFNAVGGTLTGVAGRSATLLYTNMTADTATITVTALYRGTTYVRSTKVVKLADIDPSDIDVDLSPENLKDILEGQITESQLYADLQTRIGLVDGSPFTPGTVNFRVKAEADARVAALTQEATNRTTYVQNYTYSQEDIDESLSIQASTITSAYRNYADAAKTNAISAAAADIRSYAYSQSGTNEAIAATANTLRSEFSSNNGASVAWVQSYAFSKSDTTGAIAAKADELRAEFSSNNGVSVAYLQNYAYSKVDTNTAISDATSVLSTTVGEHTTKLQTQATSLNGLSAQYTVKIDNNGYVTGYGLASTTVNGVPTSSFIINADRFAVVAQGLAPKVMFAVGNVAGQTAVGINGSVVIDGSVTANALAVGSVTAGKIAAGAITARSLSVGTSDNIVLDPAFRDIVWWGRPSASVLEYTSFWRTGRAMYFDAVNSGVESDTSSAEFPMTPGATYKFEFQAYIDSAFQGNLTISALIPSSHWHMMGGPLTGTNWAGDNLPVQFNTASAKGSQNFSVLYTVPDNTANAKSKIRLRVQVSAGYVLVGSVAITRVSDSTLIQDGAITTNKILAGSVGTNQLSISQGGAISSGQVGFDNGNGFWIEGVGAGHGARMSMGNSVGKKFLCDPANGILGLYNADIDGLNLNAFTVSIPGGNLAGSGTTSGRTYGSRTITVSGTFRGPLSYQWYVAGSTTVSGANFTLDLTGDTSSNTVSVFGSTHGASDTIKATIVCVVTDANGTSKSASFAVSQIHGNLN